MGSYVQISLSRGALRRVLQCLSAALFAGLMAGCPSVATTQAPPRPPMAEKWFRRAQADFQSADVEEARDSAANALAITPNDVDVRLLAARIALARLEYDEALRFLKGVKSSDASGLRGRALSSASQLASTTRPWEVLRSIPTPPATTTQRWVLMPFSTTLLA